MHTEIFRSIDLSHLYHSLVAQTWIEIWGAQDRGWENKTKKEAYKTSMVK